MSDKTRPDKYGTIRFAPASRFSRDPRDVMLSRALSMVGLVSLLLFWRVLLVI